MSQCFNRKMSQCEYCKQLFSNKSSLTRHINKGRCNKMSALLETKQLLDAIKLLKDSHVPESQIYLTLKAKYSGKNTQSIQDCIRSLKEKQVEKVKIVSSKVDEMLNNMELSPTHKQLIKDLKDEPGIIENEIAFVNFYSYYIQQFKLCKDESTADTFLIAETFLSTNISNELFNKTNDLENVLHKVGTKNDEPPAKYQRTSSSSSTESLHEDLNLVKWLTDLFK